MRPTRSWTTTLKMTNSRLSKKAYKALIKRASLIFSWCKMIRLGSWRDLANLRRLELFILSRVSNHCKPSQSISRRLAPIAQSFQMLAKMTSLKRGTMRTCNKLLPVKATKIQSFPPKPILSDLKPTAKSRITCLARLWALSMSVLMVQQAHFPPLKEIWACPLLQPRSIWCDLLLARLSSTRLSTFRTSMTWIRSIFRLASLRCSRLLTPSTIS